MHTANQSAGRAVSTYAFWVFGSHGLFVLLLRCVITAVYKFE